VKEVLLWGRTSCSHPHIPYVPIHPSVVTDFGYGQEDASPPWSPAGCPQLLVSYLLSSGMKRNDDELGKGSLPSW